MKIIIDDHAPGAGAGRSAYLEGRTSRVLGQMSERLQEITVELRPDDEHAGHCRVSMAARLRKGATLRVSVQRRQMADALADAFDALVTRIALSGLRLNKPEDASAFGQPPAPRQARRPRAV